MSHARDISLEKDPKDNFSDCFSSNFYINHVIHPSLNPSSNLDGTHGQFEKLKQKHTQLFSDTSICLFTPYF